MNADRALAAGQSGIPTHSQTLEDDAKAAPASQETLSPIEPLSRDEVIRQSAAQELAGYLARGGSMIARCEALSKASRGNRLGPIYAAARLMNANAQVAKALAQVALVENRHRTIVETIQQSAPKNGQLNSPFTSAEEQDDARAALEKRLDAILKTTREEQERLEDLAIDCCI